MTAILSQRTEEQHALVLRGADGNLYHLPINGPPLVVGDDSAGRWSSPWRVNEGIQTLLSPTATHSPCAVWSRHRIRL